MNNNDKSQNESIENNNKQKEDIKINDKNNNDKEKKEKNNKENNDKEKEDKETNEQKKNVKISDLIKAIKIDMKKNKKKVIPHSTIDLFYEKPNFFFNNYKTLLEKTSFYDPCGISIFSHYFYILFEKYKKNKKSINNDSLDIYDINFNSFFIENKKYLLIQDSFLDTPLHKIARLRDKTFFLLICQRLIEINILNEEILTIKNKKEESIYHYIVNDISHNYILLINKNNHMNYKIITSNYSNLIESLSVEEKNVIINYNLGVSYEYINFNKNYFNNVYHSLMMLININNNNIYLNLNNYFNNGINYLNYLFHLCKEDNDYNNLFTLIIKHLIKEESLENLIYDHTGYTLRKMKMDKKKTNKEINYGIKLINYILENNIKYKTKKQIYKILFSRKIIHKKKKLNLFNEGLVYNVIYNNYLNFEQKSEIFDIINKICNVELEKRINHETIYIYRLFKEINKNKISKNNIIELFNKYEYIKIIFCDFIIYILLYRFINQICDKINNKYYYHEFINNINIIMNKDYYFNIIYKIRYSLSDDKIKKILELILLFSEEIYDKNSDLIVNLKYNNVLLVKKKIDFEKLKYEFIILNQQLLISTLKYLLISDKTNENKSIFFQMLMFCKYDLTDFINENKDNIISLIKESKALELKLKDNINLNNINCLLPFIKDYPNLFNYIFEDSPQSILNNVNKSNTSISNYTFFFFIFDFFKNINILSTNNINFLYDLKLLINKTLLHFINEWDKPYDYSEFLNLVEPNLLAFCRILIYNENDTLEENIYKLNFFFDFLKELKPELQNKCDEYNNMTIQYISSVSKDYEFQAIDSKTLGYFYFMIILLYVHNKIGDYNPELLFFFTYYYNQYNNIFIMFIKCIKENKNDLSNIKNHFFLGKFNKNKKNINFINKIIKVNISFKNDVLFFLIDNLQNFFNKYLSDLNEIKYSLVIDYIFSLLTNIGKYEREKKHLIPSIILNIGQNKKIINKIIQKIASGEIFLYEFLNVKYDLENKNKFRKIIHIIDKESKNIDINNICNNNNFICPESLTNRFLISHGYNIINLILNVYQLFQGLKKKSIPLFLCVNTHFVFLIDTIFLIGNLLIIFNEKYHFSNNLSLNNNDRIFITEEIYDFLISFCYYYKDSEQKTDLLTIRKYLNKEMNLGVFINIFYLKIKNFNNRNSVIIEYDKFIEFIKFYFIINENENNDNKTIVSIKLNSYNYEYHFESHLKKLLILFAEEIPEKCISFIKFFLEHFIVDKDVHHYVYCIKYIVYYIIINIICKDIEKNKLYLKDFLTLIIDDSNSKLVMIKKNYIIINYLVRNTEYKDYLSINVNSLKDVFFLIINDTKDKELTKYLINQIKIANIFPKEEDFFLSFLEKGNQNEYAFDYLINLLSEEKKEEFFKENKNKIINSLFLYVEINAYVIFQNLLNFISKYMSFNDIRKIIYPIKSYEDINNSINYIEFNLKKSNQEYLFFVCLSNRKIINYEILAILFYYCPMSNAILDLCPFFINNIEKITKDIKVLKYLSYFKNIKNRTLIKSLNNSFYNFSIFIEKLFDTLNSFNDNNIEKKIFIYYIIINIFETTPNELLIFFDFEINKEIYDEDWFKDELQNRQKKRKIEEINLFIILAFYELKRLPIISIKNYLPEFYSIIEVYYKKYKQLNFPSINLKKPFDIMFYERLKFVIENKVDKLIKHLRENYSLFNLIFILEKENNMILDLSSIDDNYLTKVIYNLVENNEIEAQISENNNNIKDCILSIKDFNFNSSIIIKQCFQKDISNNKIYFEKYLDYLRIILNVCNYILTNSLYTNGNYKDNNFYLFKINLINNSIFEQYNEKLKILKNKIDITQISNYIIKTIEEIETLDRMNYFNVIKYWIKYYSESIEITNLFKDLENETFTYLTYFKYLKLTCTLIIMFLKQLKEIFITKFDDIKIKKKPIIKNIDFIMENDKNIVKDLFGKSLYKLGEEVLKNIENKQIITYETNITIGYYYNKQKNEFVETFTDINLLYFIKDKMFSLITFIKDLDKKDLIICQNNNDNIDNKKNNKSIEKKNNNNNNNGNNNENKNKENKNKENNNNEKKNNEIKKDENNNNENNENKNNENNNNENKNNNNENNNNENNNNENNNKEKKNNEKKNNENKNKDNKKENNNNVSSTLYLNKNLNESNIIKIIKLLDPHYEGKKEMLKIFFNYEEYKNIIPSYFQKTCENIDAPKIDFFYIVYNKVYNLYYHYLYPPYSFNKFLSKYCQNINIFTNSQYETIIDFYELIKAIKESKFHEDDYLNIIFQEYAIYYIIKNKNSLINIFINEVYKLIYDEMEFRKDEEIIIKNKFKIIVKKGFKYNSEKTKNILQEINNLLKDDKKDNQNNEKNENNINLNKQKNEDIIIPINEKINNQRTKKKKIKLKLKSNADIIERTQTISTEENQNITKDREANYIVIKNIYKRKNIPIYGYQGFIPQINTVIGISKINHMTNIFGNEIFIENKLEVNKLNLKKNQKDIYDNIKGRKRLKAENVEEIKINIFNLIFKIGSVYRKEIIINQYDISQILRTLEKEKFLCLINQSFYGKTIVNIPDNWNKILNLSLIYSTLEYKYVEKYNNYKEIGTIKLNKDY